MRILRLIASLSLAALLDTRFVRADEGEVASPVLLIEELFEHYNLSTTKGMLKLYKDMAMFANVTSGGPVEEKEDDHSGHAHLSANEKPRLFKREEESELVDCLLPNDLLKFHNISISQPISERNFTNMAPSLIYLSSSRVCQKFAVASNGSVVSADALRKELDDTDPETLIQRASAKLPIGLVWLYSIISVTIITLIAALGLVFVPIVLKRPVLGDLIMTFLVALGAGTLIADALLHLIPELLREEEEGVAHADHSASVWHSSVIMAAIYVFWVIEKLLHYKFHSHDKGASSKSVHPDETTSMNSSAETQELQHTEKSFVRELTTAKPVAILVILGDTFHNFVDGVVIGASFATNPKLGITSSLAILFHEVPHELGDYSVLLSAGISRYRAAFWNMISNISAYAGMILGILLIQNSSNANAVTKWILAVAAGCFLYIALVDLIPELNNIKVLDIKDAGLIRKNALNRQVAQHFGLFVGWLIMLMTALYGENLTL